MDYAIKVGNTYHPIGSGHKPCVRSSGCSKLIECNNIKDALEFMDQLYDGAKDDGQPERFELVASIRYPNGAHSAQVFPVVRIEPVVREYREEV